MSLSLRNSAFVMHFKGRILFQKLILFENEVMKEYHKTELRATDPCEDGRGNAIASANRDNSSNPIISIQKVPFTCSIIYAYALEDAEGHTHTFLPHNKTMPPVQVFSPLKNVVI